MFKVQLLYKIILISCLSNLLQPNMRNQIQDFHGTRSIKEAEDSFRQQNGLKFEEEANKVLYLEYGFVCCCKLDTSKSRPE